MTSNVGAKKVSDFGGGVGFATSSSEQQKYEVRKSIIQKSLKQQFNPEFLNRIDEIIVFNHLTRIDIWQICGLMIKQVQNRLREKGINLIVELSVQAFLTDEGYDPIYGARPLRRAIMKYLEDTLAEQCLSKTLYPNTKIIVRRKKVEGTLLTYTNELEVEIDLSDVDPQLLQNSSELKSEPIPVLVDSGVSPSNTNNSIEESDDSKPKLEGRSSRFFNRSKDK